MSLKYQDQNDCALAYKTLSCHHAVSYINLSDGKFNAGRELLYMYGWSWNFRWTWKLLLIAGMIRLSISYTFFKIFISRFNHKTSD